MDYNSKLCRVLLCGNRDVAHRFSCCVILGTNKCIWCWWTVRTCSILCCRERKEAGSGRERVKSHSGSLCYLFGICI